MSLRTLTLNTHTETHKHTHTLTHTHTHTQMTKHSQTPKALNGTIKVIKSGQSTRAWNCSSFQCYQSHTEFKSGRKQNKTWPLTGPLCSSYWHAKIYTYVPPETAQWRRHVSHVRFANKCTQTKTRPGFCAWFCFLFPKVRNQWGHAEESSEPEVSVKWVYSELLLASAE